MTLKILRKVLMLAALAAASAAFAPVALLAQEDPGPTDYGAIFAKTDAMIPMRDGVKLHTEIYVPKDAKEALPFFLTRTPYGIGDDAKGFTGLLRIYKEMFADGYIFVFQDIRGKYGSEGQFVMQRPPRNRKDAKSIDEGTDTYDTIDWLLKNVPNNNGRVGEAGISYGGWLTAMSILEPHPALKAISEQASPVDMYIGDDFHHNGAFRLSYGFEYAAMMEAGKETQQFNFDKYDTYEWYLALGPLSNANAKYLHGKIPTWNDFVNHPNYDEFWQTQAFPRYFRDLKLTVPNLNVAGWWDQEDFYGPVKIYELLEKNDTNHFNYLAAGPWRHGSWASGTGQKLGNIDFVNHTSEYFRKEIQAPWFAYWLHDKGARPAHEATTFETGSNTWKNWDAWPPKDGVVNRKLYFRADGKLSFDAPSDAAAFDEYVSDPANPVPYRPRPVEETYSEGSRWGTWLLEDQRFVDHRPDVLTWQTDVLTDDMTVAGDVMAHLFASTSGTDSDWVVKLIDVYPQSVAGDRKMSGYELMISNEVFRGRFRNSFEKPEPLVANQVAPFAIDIHTTDHVFLKGHRIMVQVQSTWFPIIDRNPQKYVPNIFKAEAADYQKAAQHIHRSKQYASNVELPVVAK
jgi:putative CocE/NonD family hydrolase